MVPWSIGREQTGCYEVENQLENPIKRFRTANHKTQVDFAGLCGVHPAAVVLNEQGCYPRILPEIRRYIISVHLEGTSRCGMLVSSTNSMLDREYQEFQLQKRRLNGAKYGINLLRMGPPAPGSPVVQFRAYIGIAIGHPTGLSRLGFCKEFCLHPAELYSLERGRKYMLSEQFKTAMRQAGLSDTVLEELEFRCEEYARGEWVTN